MDSPETTEPPAEPDTGTPEPAAVPPLATGGVVENGPAIEPGPAPFVMPVQQEQPEAAAEPGLPPGRYRFTYRDTTIYAALGVTAEPDSVHDWPDGPPTDGRWTLATEGA